MCITIDNVWYNRLCIRHGSIHMDDIRAINNINKIEGAYNIYWRTARATYYKSEYLPQPYHPDKALYGFSVRRAVDKFLNNSSVYVCL